MSEENHRIWGAGVGRWGARKGRRLNYREKFWVDGGKQICRNCYECEEEESSRWWEQLQQNCDSQSMCGHVVYFFFFLFIVCYHFRWIKMHKKQYTRTWNFPSSPVNLLWLTSSSSSLAVAASWSSSESWPSRLLRLWLQHGYTVPANTLRSVTFNNASDCRTDGLKAKIHYSSFPVTSPQQVGAGRCWSVVSCRFPDSITTVRVRYS